MVMTMMMAFAKSFTVPSPKHFHLLLHFSLLVALWGMQDWLASQVFIYIYIYFIFLGPQNTMFTKIHQARILLILPRAFAPVWCLCCWCWAVKQSGPEAQSSMTRDSIWVPTQLSESGCLPSHEALLDSSSWCGSNGLRSEVGEVSEAGRWGESPSSTFRNVDRMVWEAK